MFHIFFRISFNVKILNLIFSLSSIVIILIITIPYVVVIVIVGTLHIHFLFRVNFVFCLSSKYIQLNLHLQFFIICRVDNDMPSRLELDYWNWFGLKCAKNRSKNQCVHLYWDRTSVSWYHWRPFEINKPHVFFLHKSMNCFHFAFDVRTCEMDERKPYNSSIHSPSKKMKTRKIEETSWMSTVDMDSYGVNFSF